MQNNAYKFNVVHMNFVVDNCRETTILTRDVRNKVLQAASSIEGHKMNYILFKVHLTLVLALDFFAVSHLSVFW